MTNNGHGTKIKDNTCPEEQTIQKSNTDKTSPMERPKGGCWHCSVLSMHGICLKSLISVMSPVRVSRSFEEGKWKKVGNRDVRKGFRLISHLKEEWP